ncbi:MAG: FAD-binding oxidoreductase [Simkaniaceae bacterium]|jgi:glycine/D-amino acid oxidase-like deaminating enzyme|nr:MAG: FAD-binding oxidoreductase [Simkaniaceae bacterium]
MKKIAIVGGGFSGLGLTYHLLKRGGNVTLFDGKGIGGGASGIASGLLHPYPGESARLSWMGDEGMEETKNLLKLVGKEVYKESGILKIAVTPKQENAFRKLERRYEDIEWWDAEKCHAFMKGSHYRPGIFIKSGITVHAPLYLKGLWKVCETLGAQFENRKVSLSDLEGFDVVVLAAGAGIRGFAAGEGLDLRFNKGQILVCQKPSYFENESSLIGKGYLALSEVDNRCYLGSTYERDYRTEAPCMGTATDLIFKQIGQFIPSYSSFKVEKCLSEMRVVSGLSYPRPIAKQLGDRLYIMTGMGSRGLLYHAYLGKQLAEEMV